MEESSPGFNDASLNEQRSEEGEIFFLQVVSGDTRTAMQESFHHLAVSPAVLISHWLRQVEVHFP